MPRALTALASQLLYLLEASPRARDAVHDLYYEQHPDQVVHGVLQNR